ncbi:MAG: hypothetical protein ABF991_11225 [Liquorilactobacillus hordei]|uniref:hypothetical protein n=1 Tax=Liquorilactobacillus hordei TaxID=468911 RepID=UPI0015E81FA8|nr:hypothetical protein [Liquorilactobacillus hordei]
MHNFYKKDYFYAILAILILLLLVILNVSSIWYAITPPIYFIPSITLDLHRKRNKQ